MNWLDFGVNLCISMSSFACFFFTDDMQILATKQLFIYGAYIDAYIRC